MYSSDCEPPGSASPDRVSPCLRCSKQLRTSSSTSSSPRSSDVPETTPANCPCRVSTTASKCLPARAWYDAWRQQVHLLGTRRGWATTTITWSAEVAGRPWMSTAPWAPHLAWSQRRTTGSSSTRPRSSSGVIALHAASRGRVSTHRRKQPTVPTPTRRNAMTDQTNSPAAGDGGPTLTNRQGHPVYDNQNQRTVGARGPATLENYQFLEKMSHFDRERVPERVVHDRGAVAYGYFEANGTWGDEPISTYTRARLFQEEGKRTDLAIRFSTVAGGRDSSEVARDPRGFAIKMYTEEGNWDLVGNNLGIFFIRDAIKFPEFIHSQKPDPVNFNRQDPNRVFDFISQSPEALHMIMLVFSPRGVPASYRHQQGFGVNTYKWVNAAGESVLVKYHWIPKQGVKSLTAQDAANIQATELGSHTKDLYEAIESGDYPEWELRVQMMSDDEHPELDFDPLDDTKLWPEEQFPPKPVGRMVLNRNVENFFAESEQLAFGTGVLVDAVRHR